jgi:hypothetical protein
VISRGVELCDAEDNVVATQPNTVTLHKLILPSTPTSSADAATESEWQLESVRRFGDLAYLSNAWLMRIASNGRYIVAPTCNGAVFIWNVATGDVVGLLHDHEGLIPFCHVMRTPDLIR